MDISFPVFLRKKVDYVKKANLEKKAYPSYQDPEIPDLRVERLTGSLSKASS
jgi:hypothetical protein